MELGETIDGYLAPCAAICLDSAGGDGGYVLAGTVAADATAIRITLDNHTQATYPLTGPIITPTKRRVFIVDLGAHDWRKLELGRDGTTTSTVTMSPRRAAYEDCSKRVHPQPPPPTETTPGALTATMNAYAAALNNCVRTAIGEPGPLLPAFP